MNAYKNIYFLFIKNLRGKKKTAGEKQLRTFCLWTIKHFCELGKRCQCLI